MKNRWHGGRRSIVSDHMTSVLLDWRRGGGAEAEGRGRLGGWRGGVAFAICWSVACVSRVLGCSITTGEEGGRRRGGGEEKTNQKREHDTV